MQLTLLEILETLYGTGQARYTPGAVANWFVQKSINLQKPIDHMQLQKLVYFAHGRFMARHNDPLVKEPAEAWRFGPIFQSIYHEYKKFGAGNIPLSGHYLMREPVFSGSPKKITFEVKKVDKNDLQTQDLLTEIWQTYSGFSGIQLSDMTHRDHPGNPWRFMCNFMKQIGLQKIDIPNTLIQKYFKELEMTNATH